MGHSHVAISRVTRPLTRAGLVGEANHPRDGRRVMLILLDKGVALLERLEPIQDAIVAAIDGMAGSRPLLRAVRAFEEALQEQGFAARVRARKTNGATEVAPFEDCRLPPWPMEEKFEPLHLVGGLDR